jgi:hypothetical protein
MINIHLNKNWKYKSFSSNSIYKKLKYGPRRFKLTPVKSQLIDESLTNAQQSMGEFADLLDTTLDSRESSIEDKILDEIVEDLEFFEIPHTQDERSKKRGRWDGVHETKMGWSG